MSVAFFRFFFVDVVLPQLMSPRENTLHEKVEGRTKGKVRDVVQQGFEGARQEKKCRTRILKEMEDRKAEMVCMDDARSVDIYGRLQLKT